MVIEIQKDEFGTVLERLWPTVRERYLFPEVPFPDIVDFPSDWPAMVMRERQILVNRIFLQKYEEIVGLEELLTAILTHGLGHHATCPWDFATHVQIYTEAQKVLDEADKARLITDAFMDVVVNHFCFTRGWHEILQLLQKVSAGTQDRLVYPLYERLWNTDLGTSGVPPSGDILEYLSEIDYLDKGRWNQSIRKFARVLRSTVLDLDPLSISLPPLMGFHTIYSYGKREFSKAVQNLAYSASDPITFRKAFSSLNDSFGHSSNGETRNKMGRGKGREAVAEPYYYMALAEKYYISVRKRKMKEDGAFFPHSHESWGVSDPFYDIDIWNSMGMVLPSVTVKWKKKANEAFTYKEKVPDCLIMIDSSGSMPDPAEVLSYAVLGAGSAADAYLREGARISVYNFSDAPAGNKKILLNSRNRIEIFETLCTYFGGGTAIEVQQIERIVEERSLDLFLITDMEIVNLENLIKFFRRQKNFRVTAVHIGEKKAVERFQKAAEEIEFVNVFGIKEPEDIPKIVLGQVKTYIHGNPDDENSHHFRYSF